VIICCRPTGIDQYREFSGFFSSTGKFCSFKTGIFGSLDIYSIKLYVVNSNERSFTFFMTDGRVRETCVNVE